MPVNSNIHPLMLYVVFEEQGLMIICFCNICLVNIGHEIFASFSMEIFLECFIDIYMFLTMFSWAATFHFMIYKYPIYNTI